MNIILDSSFGTSLDRFFDEASDSTVSLPQCDDCQKFHWYPMERCPHCQSSNLRWRPVSATGVVFSKTVVRRSFTDVTEGDVPYGIVLVEVDEAPSVRLVCRFDPNEPISIGTPVKIKVVSNPNSLYVARG